VEENIATWKDQINCVLDLHNKDNPVRIERNSKWLSKLNFEDVVDLASNFTVQQMVERDMFENRIKEGKPVYVHEFMYPLMVGYDSVVLDVDIELGGNDQTFNMLAGRTLQKVKGGKDKFVVATTLLENPLTGKKLMSKSEGGYVSLQDVPNEMYGKIMALPDETIIPLFVDATWCSVKEIAVFAKEVKTHPKETKMKLARTIVSIYHNEEEAAQAEKNWEAAFSKGGVPEVVDEIVAKPKTKLADVFMSEKVVNSKSELRRLVESGAVTHTETGEKVLDMNKIAKIGIYKIGKKRFVKIVVKK